MYAVVFQESGMHQGLLAVKVRLAKKGLTMPGLELISSPMAAKLVDNVRSLYGPTVQYSCIVSLVKGATNNLCPIELYKLRPM